MKIVKSELTLDVITLVSWIDINSSVLFLIWTCNNNIVPLCLLTNSYSVWQLLLWSIEFTMVTFWVKILIDLLTVRLELGSNWANKNLSWWEEEWPFSSKMLNQNSHESLNWSQDSSVDHDWSCKALLDGLLLPGIGMIVIFISWEDLGFKDLFLFIFFNILVSLILEVEPDWQVEIKLDGTTLVMSLKSIEYLDINLWSIESTISWVLFPWFSRSIQCLCKSSLSFVPHLISSKSFFWSGR